MTDKLIEAIELLKVNRPILGRISDDMMEAVDTVVAEVEKPTYTAEDMEAFAEWLIGRSADWITDEERCETAETFIEMWEKERGGEMNDFAKCFGENCPLKENCKRYLEGIGAIDWFVAPMYSVKKQSCMNIIPLVQKITKK